MSQLRLENYLFTVESAKRAFSLLKPQGDLVYYNFYRQSWLPQKLEKMIYEATGRWPNKIYQKSDFSIIRLRKTHAASSPGPAASAKTLEVPSDNWPFLYLKERSIPLIYRYAIGGLMSVVFLLLGFLHWHYRQQPNYFGRQQLAIKLSFILMGIAFLLLETKSVIQFSLLFGTTWLNNSLVFLAVLLLVLVANWLALLFQSKIYLPLFFILLIGSSFFSAVFPLRHLLYFENVFWRFIFASIITFSPIFFANLIFSLLFRDQPIAEHLFGWNLIGATIGGMVEYLSMWIGYNNLSLIVAGCYGMVWLLVFMAQRWSAPLAAPAAKG
jgi:hypothetical protein